MGKIFRPIFLSIALVGILTSCGDNVAKNKLINGEIISGDDPASFMIRATNSAQTIAVGALMTGAGSQIGPMLSPIPAPAVYRIPVGVRYDYRTGYYTMGNVGLRDGSTGSVKIRFSCIYDRSKPIFGGNGSPTDYIDAEDWSWVHYVHVIISGRDPAGNAFIADHIATLSGTFDISANMTFVGAVTMSGPYGNFTVTSSNLVVVGSGPEEGRIMSGTQTGSGTLPNGTQVSISLTWNNGQADGTVSVNGAAVPIHIAADGSATYTDQSGTHSCR